MKQEKTFAYVLRLSLTLLVITALVAAALAGVNAITAPVIAQLKAQKTQQAIEAVLPGGGTSVENFTDETGLVTAVYASDSGYAIQAPVIIGSLKRMGVTELDYLVITHPHGDHFGAAEFLSKSDTLKARVKINRFLMCMPPLSFVDAGRGTAYEGLIRTVHSIAENCGVPELLAKKGEIYETDDLRTEILLTNDDLTSPAADPNETSLIFRVHAAGNTILFLGDTYSKPAKQLADEMGEALKSDFCQLAHHALNGGHEELYRYAAPEIALVPMARPAFDAMTVGDYKESAGTRHNRTVLLAYPEEKLWISADGTRVVELPY
jgi:beta-lactamase superfamily II metal-dependent hydrolase